jgi:hypothetical protein
MCCQKLVTTLVKLVCGLGNNYGETKKQEKDITENDTRRRLERF